MNWTALWVVAGGAALAVGVNLYYFSPRREGAVVPPLPVPRASTEPAPPPLTPPVMPEGGQAHGVSPVTIAPAVAPEHAEPPPKAAPADDAAP
jgi:hypothetical protein